MLAPPLEDWRPLLRGILDPPLNGLCHGKQITAHNRTSQQRQVEHKAEQFYFGKNTGDREVQIAIT